MRNRLGIDVGGTNTDAVVLDGDDELIAKAKRPTTADVTTGIIDALDDVLERGNVDIDDLAFVMLGTTHCTNALTERRELNEVGVIRVGAPATLSIPPLIEWPSDLLEVIGDNVAVVEGGYEFDGRLLKELNEHQIREQVREFADVDAFAVTGVFSPVRNDHEKRVAEIIREEVGDEVSVSLSHEIGSVGLIERENATAMNAALTNVAEQAATSFLRAMDERDIDARFYFGQNDGTLMNVDYAIEYPIFTVASGPANSIRGAAYLSDVSDGIIVDVGGTTTDVGALAEGFPRESSTAVEIGGVKTNFRMPDLISIGIGGGSHVRVDDDHVVVGPESVGYKLTEVAQSFGGDVCTTTDIEVAAGAVSIGSTVPDIEQTVVRKTRSHVQSRIEEAIDRMKTSPDPVPVVVVGGGSIVVQDGLEPASEMYTPEDYEVANAVGVAIAQVSGDVDRIYSLEDRSRDSALAQAKQEAVENAVEAGARRETAEISTIEEVPLAYLPGNAIRIKVKAVGELRR